MVNPLRYVERLLKWQQRFSPVYPMSIVRKLFENKDDSYLQILWMCNKYWYSVLIFQGNKYFKIRKIEIDTPSNYCPSYKGYYETIDFCHSHLLFDEIEFLGKDRVKYIEKIKGFRIQSIKEQCFI